jgi:hypothetical protein
MTSFYLFAPAKSAIENNSLNISIGNYYAVLVQTLPDVNTTTVGGLNFCSGVGYTAVPLSGLVYIPNSKWTFDDFRFSKAQFSTPVLGVVICKRLGTLPAITDIPIVFSSLINNFNYPYILKPGKFSVDVDIPTDGLIQFEIFTGYSSGTWNGSLPYTADIFSSIGTQNNTVTYANPCIFNPVNNKVRSVLVHNNGAVVDIATATDKGSSSIGFDSNYTSLIFDFWGMNATAKKLVRPGKFQVLSLGGSSASGSGIPLFGSNDPAVYANPNNPTYWTALATGSNYSNLSGGSDYIQVTDPTYWRFLKYVNSYAGLPFTEFALYESNVISASVNFS